jgi:hypothetical protein
MANNKEEKDSKKVYSIINSIRLCIGSANGVKASSIMIFYFAKNVNQLTLRVINGYAKYAI